MWHEARRQEKLLRSTMIDQSKRAERKRRYFENVRKDPEQFMQIHGRKAQIHADLGIAKAAEDSNILRAWQGDPKITIDRFDVRSHLSKMDLMDEEDELPKKKHEENSSVDEKEQIVTDFERYRVLIINDYKKVTEKQYLRRIADREFYTNEKEQSKKLEAEKKKKLADKKSTIGFSYEDSEVVKGFVKNDASDEESEEEIDEMLDLDVDLDVGRLNPETQRVVNKSGEEFGVKRGLFCALLKADQQALRDAAQLKQIDRQKAQLSGRESKHERMLLRQQRQAIVGKGLTVGDNGATATLLGFINQSQKKTKIDEIIEDLEGSDDDDDDDGDHRKRRKSRGGGVKQEFITTFGGTADRESDDEGRKVAAGPELPSEEYRKILKLSKNRGRDEEEVDWGGLKAGGGGGTDRRMSRSRSRDRYSRRRRSSRSRSRDRDRDRRRDQHRRRSSRSRSRDRNRRRRSRSTSRRRRRTRSRSKDRRRDRSREERRRRQKSVEPRRDPAEKIPDPKTLAPKLPEVKSDSSGEESGAEDVKMLEIRSSMSESEKERAEIENRKRRVKLTKRMVKEKRGMAAATAGDEKSSDDGGGDDGDEKQKLARRVKLKMSQALKKTRLEMAKEEEERRKEAEVAQRVRDELRYIELQERRERERAKHRKTATADGPKSPRSP